VHPAMESGVHLLEEYSHPHAFHVSQTAYVRISAYYQISHGPYRVSVHHDIHELDWIRKRVETRGIC
jgi:hypothetical protein